MAAGDARQASIAAQRPKPRSTGAGFGVGSGPFGGPTPVERLGVKPKVHKPAPNRAPYKPGQAPEQKLQVAHPHTLIDPRVVQMQQHLTDLGYNVQIDGVMGPETRTALQMSHNGTVPNALHSSQHSQLAAQQHLAQQGAKATVVSHLGSRRFQPWVEGQQPSGYVGAFRGPDGQIYMPGTRAPAGSRITNVPYYVNPSHAPTADEQLSMELPQQTQQDIASGPRVNPIFSAVATGAGDTLATLTPMNSLAKVVNGQFPSTSDVGKDVLNGAMWLTPGIVAPLLRTARVAHAILSEEGITRNAINTMRELSSIKTEEALGAMKDARLAKAAKTETAWVGSPKRQEIEAAIEAAPNISRKQKNALMKAHDIATKAIAKTLGTTPAQAYEFAWRGAKFHDISPTADSVGAALAQIGSEPEITNVAHTPETYTPNPGTLDMAARNIPRSKLRAGAPPHATTTKGLRALLEDLTQRAIEAADYRKWYANSAAAILAHVNGDTQAADKLAALVAVYSPRAEVYSKNTEWNNLDRAINAYDEHMQTGQISPRWSISSHKTGEGDWQTSNAQKIMDGNFEWSGLKTNRFYRNFLQHIDPAKYKSLFGDEKFTTQDTWMRRAFGYPATTKTEERATLFGTEHVPVGKKQEPITPQMYAFMDRATKAVADSLGWTPEEAQAAIWTSIKAETEGTPLSQAGFDFRDALAHREARRARPLTPEQLALDTTNATSDTPAKSAVNAAIDASRAPDGGFTLTAGLNPDAGHDGFAVAYGAHEFREPAPLTAKGLLDFRNEHLPLLRSDPELRVGGWHNPDDGRVYLDISRVFPTREEAIQFGREQGQLSIYDRANNDVIPTGLSAEQADAIKAQLKEQGRLQKQVAKYNDLLDRAHEMVTGTTKKTLNAAERKGTEDMLFEWATKNEHLPEAKQFLDLQHEASIAQNAPDPELLFQDDGLVHDIAAAHGKSIDRTEILDASRGNDLGGLPKTRASNKDAQQVASEYMRGKDYSPPTTYAKVYPARAKRIAEWYDKAVSAPNDPAVRASYDAMIHETLDQYNAITKAGYRFEFYPNGVDPYPSGPSAAIDDLRANRHMYVFPTDAGFGSGAEAAATHPLLGDSGVRWGDRSATHNDIFRAVHDFFGHFKEGVGFRADGEENAWRSHVAMYSPEARPAMTAETRGQNSWVNYGPHGEANKTADQAATVYADQKAVIAPEWVVREGSGQGAIVKGAVERGAGGAFMHLFRTADTSTVLHELAHIIEPHMPSELRMQLRAEAVRTGAKNYDEFVARAMERYFMEGQAPTKRLARTFRTLAKGMHESYSLASMIPGAHISPEIKAVFDKWFAREIAADPEWAIQLVRSLHRQDDAGEPRDLLGRTQADRNREVANALSEGVQREDDRQSMLNTIDDIRNAEPSDFFLQTDHTNSAEELASQHGINLADVKGTGQDGRVTKGDVEQHIFDHMSPQDQLRSLMKGLRIARGKTEVAYSEERGKRFANVANTYANENLTPMERHVEALSHLKGELPVVRVNGKARTMSQSTMESLMNDVQQHPYLRPGQKTRVNDALISLVTHGKPPTRSELALMQHVWGRDTVSTLQQIQSRWHGLKNTFLSLINIPRAIMSSTDASFGLRQALVAAAYSPRTWFKAWRQQFLYATKWATKLGAKQGGEEAYQALMRNVHARPNFPLYQEMKLAITDMETEVGLREEPYQSNLAEKLTIKGHGPGNVIRGSGRMYTGMAIQLRTELADRMLAQAAAAGYDVTNPENLQKMGHFINAITGRGDLPGEVLNQSAPLLNAIFFSPRLLASRIQMLNPVNYVRGDAFMRKQYLRAGLSTFGLLGSILAAVDAFVPGAQVGLDWRSSDFGKIRIGDTRIDLGGGFNQLFHLMGMIYTGQKKSSTTGQITSLTSNKFGQATRYDAFTSFLAGKLAPTPSMVVDWAKNRDPNHPGQPFNWQDEAASHFQPLVIQDAWNVYNDPTAGMNGIEAATAGYGLGALGVGMQTYTGKNVAKGATDKLTKEAKAAGFPAPDKSILLAVDHKAHIDSLVAQNSGNPDAGLAAVVKYYAQVTGRHDFDGVVAAAKGNKVLHDTYMRILRTILVGPGLSAYEHALKTVVSAQKTASHG